jgi:hypothetical protein
VVLLGDEELVGEGAEGPAECAQAEVGTDKRWVGPSVQEAKMMKVFLMQSMRMPKPMLRMGVTM